VSNIEQEQVRTAIQQLPVEFGEIIILREYGELSYQEIAAVLEYPLGTVIAHFSRFFKAKMGRTPFEWRRCHYVS
jgi:RNA polymerase sigma-70 factor (ECF subfamily)